VLFAGLWGFLLAAAVEARPPLPPPFTLRGQAYPPVAKLRAVICTDAPPAGSKPSDGPWYPLVSANAILFADADSTSFEAQFDSTALDRALHNAAGNLALTFDTSATVTPTWSSTPLTLAATLPPVVWAVGDAASQQRSPRLPDAFLVDRHLDLESSSAGITLTLSAVFSRQGASDAAGTLVWSSAGPPPLVNRDAATLTAGAVTFVRASRLLPSDSALNPLWRCVWRSGPLAGPPGSGGQPALCGGVTALDVEKIAVDTRGSGGALPDAPATTASAGALVYSGTMPFEAGQHLVVDFECRGVTPTALTSAVAGWSLASPSAPGVRPSFLLPLEFARVEALGPGSSWLHCSWFLSKDQSVTELRFFGPRGTQLPGSWVLRFLGWYADYSPEGSY
jgi:hypothetical protein